MVIKASGGPLLQHLPPPRQGQYRAQLWALSCQVLNPSTYQPLSPRSSSGLLHRRKLFPHTSRCFSFSCHEPDSATAIPAPLVPDSHHGVCPNTSPGQSTQFPQPVMSQPFHSLRRTRLNLPLSHIGGIQKSHTAFQMGSNEH